MPTSCIADRFPLSLDVNGADGRVLVLAPGAVGFPRDRSSLRGRCLDDGMEAPGVERGGGGGGRWPSDELGRSFFITGKLGELVGLEVPFFCGL